MAIRTAPFLLAALSLPLAAETRTCNGIEVTVTAATSAVSEMACRAAADAVGFMTAHGFQVRAPVTISVVDELSRGQAMSTLGTYDAKADHVEMLSYQAAARLLPEHPPFGIPMNPELYRSFVVHEVAHAIAHPNFVRRPNAAAQEYIAYTAQFATMPQGLRQQILDAIRTEGFDAPKEIGDQLLMLDPGRFAVKAWLHFIRPENGAAFYQRLLTGRF